MVSERMREGGHVGGSQDYIAPAQPDRTDINLSERKRVCVCVTHDT